MTQTRNPADMDLPLQCSSLLQDDAGGIDSHELIVDAGPVIARLPAEDLKELMSRFDPPLSEINIPGQLMGVMKDAFPEINQAAEAAFMAEVKVDVEALSAVIVANDRAMEVPEYYGWIVEFADQDRVDRIRARGNSESMLACEPDLDLESRPSTPGP